MICHHIGLEISAIHAEVRLPPPRLGCSVDEDVAAELRECCQNLRFEDSVRVVLFTGVGDTFAVGRQRPPADVVAADATVRMNWLASMSAANAIASLPMPTVAVLNGDAVAHGLEIAMAADLRIAADTATLGIGSLRDDGFPYDGGTQRLPRLVGPGLARDMLLTGRSISAREAMQVGLVNRVAPPEELESRTRQLVQEIQAAAPIANRYAKEAAMASGDLTMTQGLRLEADLSVMLHSTEDRAAGLLSFSEKRAPRFKGR